ncbi:MAG: NADH-quinone oxidoreductase subunit NuoH [Pirellulaceae bacterium]
MIAALIKIGILIGGLMTAAAYFVLLERRMAAWVQDRIGPNRVGVPLSLFGFKDLALFGLGQPAADGLKFIFKEEYTPAHVDKRLYVIAPIVILAAALAIFAVIPFGSMLPPLDDLGVPRGDPVQLVVVPGMDVGMLFVFALSSIAVYGVILGGWASNNKYSFLGGLRSSAQLIAYELPMGLGILGVVLAAGSLDLDKIMRAQAVGPWFAIAQPLGFLVFVIAAFAEAARLPFDLPEAEQELIGGYHTEYAGMKLLLFLVAEFLHMITASFLIVILFLGGWHFPYLTGEVAPLDSRFPEAITWFTAIMRLVVFNTKIFLVIVFFMLVRWSWPRFRYDQLMSLAWKIMLPLGLVNFVAVAIMQEARHALGSKAENLGWTLMVIVFSWGICIAAWVIAAWFNPLITDNRPRRMLATAEVDSQI